MGTKRRKKFRGGLSYLEIIVSIVVLGIVATSFPILLATIVQGVQTSWKEKAFYDEYTLLTLIINNYAWDQNNSEEFQYYIRTAGDNELQPGTYGPRVGKEEQFRDFPVGRLPGEQFQATSIGRDDGENDPTQFNDVDDWNGYSVPISGASGEINLSVEVFYAGDEADYQDPEILTFQFGPDYNNTGSPDITSSIKVIRITADNGAGKIYMTYPVFNIGAAKFLGLNEL
jgi:hypothetical protein